MTMNETMKKLQDELHTMRTHVEELRVKGNLGKMELRDKLTEYKSVIEAAYQKATTAVADGARSGTGDSKAMAKSLIAGWDELRKTHQRLTDEADRQREAAHQAKRRAD